MFEIRLDDGGMKEDAEKEKEERREEEEEEVSDNSLCLSVTALLLFVSLILSPTPPDRKWTV